MKHHYFHLQVIILVFIFAIVTSNESENKEELLDKLKLLEKENAFLKKELKTLKSNMHENKKKLIDIAGEMNKTAYPYFPNTTCFDEESLQNIIENIAKIGNDIDTANAIKNEVSEIVIENPEAFFSEFTNLGNSDLSNSQISGRNLINLTSCSNLDKIFPTGKYLSNLNAETD